MTSPSTEEFRGERYFLSRHSPWVPSIRYLGVRVKSVFRLKTASSTAWALFKERPIPKDIRKGMYLRVGRIFRPISLWDEKYNAMKEKVAQKKSGKSRIAIRRQPIRSRITMAGTIRSARMTTKR